MDSPHANDRRSRGMEPHHWGGAFGSLVTALIICCLTYILQRNEFEPLKLLEIWENQAYQQLLPDVPKYDVTPQPVVFIDIDDKAVKQWQPGAFTASCGTSALPDGSAADTAHEVKDGTPRGLIAALIAGVRKTKASVIYIDYDLRTSMAEDPLLHAELRCPSPTTVLLPHVPAELQRPRCVPDAVSADPAKELTTLFDPDAASGNIGFAHPLIAARSYGLVDSYCPAYRVIDDRTNKPAMRYAAGELVLMVAESHAHHQSSKQPLRQDDGGTLRKIRWWINAETSRIPENVATSPIVYFRVKASLLVNGGGIDTQPLMSDRLNNAIVIIGSTNALAGDQYATPAGKLPGALIHANVAVDQQARPDKELSDGWSLLIDIVVLTVFFIATAWSRIHWPVPHKETNCTRRFRARLICFCFEFAIMSSVATVFFLASWGMARGGFDVGLNYKFGITSFIIGFLVAFLVQAIGACASLVEELAIWIGDRRHADGDTGQAAGAGPAMMVEQLAAWTQARATAAAGPARHENAGSAE